MGLTVPLCIFQLPGAVSYLQCQNVNNSTNTAYQSEELLEHCRKFVRDRHDLQRSLLQLGAGESFTLGRVVATFRKDRATCLCILYLCINGVAMLLHVRKQLWLAVARVAFGRDSSNGACKGCSFSACRMIQDGFQPDILSFQAQISRAQQCHRPDPACPSRLEAALADQVTRSSARFLLECTVFMQRCCYYSSFNSTSMIRM